MMQFYQDTTRESDPHALPDAEAFYSGPADRDPMVDGPQFGLPPGWYWWSCFPGCMPDGDPSGPFDTEETAIADAREGGES